jgi:hypothetical protein
MSDKVKLGRLKIEAESSQVDEKTMRDGQVTP